MHPSLRGRIARVDNRGQRESPDKYSTTFPSTVRQRARGCGLWLVDSVIVLSLKAMHGMVVGSYTARSSEVQLTDLCRSWRTTADDSEFRHRYSG